METGMFEKRIEQHKSLHVNRKQQEEEQSFVSFERELKVQKSRAQQYSGGPAMPVMSEPANKLGKQKKNSVMPESANKNGKKVTKKPRMVRQIGGLEEKEITNTYSDFQRKSFKQNLWENAEGDLKRGGGSITAETRKILEQIKEYALIDVTGDMMVEEGREKSLEKERQLLNQIMEQIGKRLSQLEGQAASAQCVREKKFLELYSKYLTSDTEGYLKVPEQEELAALGERWHDCTNAKMTDQGRSIRMKKVSKEPLFPHEPSLNDIAQGAVGDCYLLAALSAVVNANPQWIKDCMKDNGDGSVTVRLYNDEGGILQPHYIKVSKQVPTKIGSKEPFAKGSLWVQIIEQAYVVSRLHDASKDPKKLKKTNDYQNIASGDPGKFMERVTGRKNEYKRMQKYKTDGNVQSIIEKLLINNGESRSERWRQHLGIDLPSAKERQAFAKSWSDIMDSFSTKDIAISTEEEAENYFKHQTYEDYREQELKKIKADVRIKKKNLQERLAEIRKFGPVPTDSDLQAMNFQYSSASQERKDEIEKIVLLVSEKGKIEKELEILSKKENKLEAMKKNNWRDMEINQEPDEMDLIIKYEKNHFEGMKAFFDNLPAGVLIPKAFSGRYTQLSLDLYKEIEEGAQRGKHMTAASVAEFKKEIKGKGKNGEGIDVGLVSNHAYTIVGVKESEGTKYIKLRNPWASDVRVYSEEEGEISRRKIETGTHGIFLLELNEFMVNYDGISIV